MGEWVVSLESELKEINPSDVSLESELQKINLSTELEIRKKKCIYRVPKILRELNTNAYTPQVVSFGPYHHNQDHLKSMEPDKRLALHNYLRTANKTLADVMAAMRPEVRNFMDSYDGLEESWRKNEGGFLEMMILDGCFFLDLMIWHSTHKFWKPYMFIKLWMDMLRLENQLPISVLAILIEVGGNKIKDTCDFILCYPNKNQLESIREMGLHHLDIYRKDVTISGGYSYDPYWSVRPATELHLAGVRFKQNETESLKDISFQKGFLSLPCLKFDDNTEPLLLNYMALEQILHGDNAATSYVFLMNNLINTTKDVALLREKGIIRGWLGNDGIAALFNRLTKAMTFANGEYTVNVNNNLSEYCCRRWQKFRANIIRTYLTIEIAASIILFLTLAQTLYTIISYYK